MLRLIVISALALVTLAAPRLDIKLDKHWEMWKDYENKAYKQQEELKRRLIWEENYEMINLHNLEHSLGKHTYTMAMNEFGDLTYEQFTERMKFNENRQYREKSEKSEKFGKSEKLGKSKPKPTNRAVFSTVGVTVPDTVDWRDQGYVTPVKNQGQCGSCWSFSATGSLEGQYFATHNDLQSFSEQELVDCSGPEGDYGCNGGLMDDAFKFIEDHSMETEADYPYEARDNDCRYDESKGLTEVSGYTDVTSEDEDALKKAVGKVGPISIAIDASHQSFQFYSSGVYTEPECSSTQLDHGVLVVGYGTDSVSGSDYWLVKNSWGPEWGMEGYIMMSRNNNNQCGVATQASYPIVKP